MGGAIGRTGAGPGKAGAGPGQARECGAASRVWSSGWFLCPGMAPRCWRWWPWSSWTRTWLPSSRSTQSRSRAPLGLGGSSGRPASDPVRSRSRAGAGLERGEGGDQGRDSCLGVHSCRWGAGGVQGQMMACAARCEAAGVRGVNKGSKGRP